MREPSIPFPTWRGKSWARLILGAAAVLVLAGCGGESAPMANETDEPLYKEGQRLEHEGRYQEALADYFKLIVKRGDQAPQSHLEAGAIELIYIKDPFAAVYHFNRYLELEPNSPNAADVRGQIAVAKREFLRSLPGQPTDDKTLAVASLDELERLRQENSSLRAQLTEARGSSAPPPPVYAAPAPVSPPAAAESAPAPVAADEAAPVAPPTRPAAPAPAPAAHPAGRTYTVVAHDSFFSIARKLYGTPTKARIQAIQQANPGVSSLKPGMVLHLP
ncbi:MAG TPA: LysM peptidoglycan-binding domain-containing protein [Opitutaceae bacterium]|jgi:tetratricopeptide (TPR) repeat protein|nr:LysM peptidoglycan-binding domain-containing protein [Opitutaceae bacterium]